MADNLLATQLRKGMIVKIENKLYRIFDRQHVTPGNLRGFVRVKMRNIQNGTMAEEKLRSEDIVERVSLEQKQTVDLVVTQTMPAIKGATATNQTKPATLETGVVIQVPPFIGEGDLI